MAFPKIVYNSVTLNPTYPPRQVPDRDKAVIRNINVASSGVTEQIYERSDTFLELDFANIPQSDAAAWNSFFDWADQGLTFDYYPDASVNSFTTYTLETLGSKLAYKQPGMWQLPGLKFRKFVSP